MFPNLPFKAPPLKIHAGAGAGNKGRESLGDRRSREIWAQWSSCPQITRATRNIKHTGAPLSGGDKTPVFSPRTLGRDLVNDLVTFLLSVEAELTQIPQNDNPDSSLPGPVPILRGMAHVFTAC